MDALIEALLDVFDEISPSRADIAATLAEERAAVVDAACAERWFCLQRLIAPRIGVMARIVSIDGASLTHEAMAHLALTLRSAEIAGDDDLTSPPDAEAALRDVLPVFIRTRFDEAPSLSEKLIVASVALAPDEKARLADRMCEEAALAMRYGRLKWAERRVVRSRARRIES